jgi:cation diffusion facilitator family transporter
MTIIRQQQDRDYRQIQWVLLVTLLLNLLATALKLGVGLWTGALSLIADGLDTLFDGVSNVVGILAVRVSSRPPDKEHPYGHRKFETLAALFIAGALLITAWELVGAALARLRSGETVSVTGWTLGALLVGSAIQAGTGLWELRKARELESEVLRADARHTLASIGVSGAVLVGLALVWLGYPWADPVVALIVAAVIAKIGVDTVRENVPALVDRAPLDEESIGAVVAEVSGVESFHRIRSRGTADNVAIDLHVRVAPHLPMQEANAIADEVRRRLLALPGVGDVTVHAEAQRDAESASDLYTNTKVAAQELGIALHECWVQSFDDELSLHLHVGVDPTLTLAEAHQLVDELEQTLLERRPELAAVHIHIELANTEILPSTRVSRGLQARIQAAIAEAAATIPDLGAPHNIQVRQVEGRLFISLEALVDGALSVTDAHELSTQLQDAIRATVPNVGEALVHLEPVERTDGNL